MDCPSHGPSVKIFHNQGSPTCHRLSTGRSTLRASSAWSSWWYNQEEDRDVGDVGYVGEVGDGDVGDGDAGTL